MKYKTTLVSGLLAVTAAAALAGCGGDDDGTNAGDANTRPEATTQPREATEGATDQQTRGETSADRQFTGESIAFRDGEPVGGIRELEYDAGDLVQFRVSSDVADEVHVHGYDLSKEVPAGGAIALSFPADIEGIFEIELEEQGVQIAELRVNP